MHPRFVVDRQPRSLHVAEGRSTTHFGYIFDTEINQFELHYFDRLVTSVGYNLEVTMHVKYSLSMTTSKLIF